MWRNAWRDKAPLIRNFLQKSLPERIPATVLIAELVGELTSQSLQSKDQVLRAASFFDIPSNALTPDIRLLDRIFQSRNQISHEMDVDLNQPNRNRRPRGKECDDQPYRKQSCSWQMLSWSKLTDGCSSEEAPGRSIRHQSGRKMFFDSSADTCLGVPGERSTRDEACLSRLDSARWCWRTRQARAREHGAECADRAQIVLRRTSTPPRTT